MSSSPTVSEVAEISTPGGVGGVCTRTTTGAMGTLRYAVLIVRAGAPAGRVMLGVWVMLTATPDARTPVTVTVCGTFQPVMASNDSAGIAVAMPLALLLGVITTKYGSGGGGGSTFSGRESSTTV